MAPDYRGGASFHRGAGKLIGGPRPGAFAETNNDAVFVSRFANDNEVVLDWLRRTGVLTVPGSGFGQVPGTAHFRVVTLAPPDVLRRAMASLADTAAMRG